MRRRYVLAFIWSIALFCGTPVRAVQPDEILNDPSLETRARALSSELRCLVCQNQSIDDSAAPLARDLRLLVRERLKAGDSDTAVKAYLVSRYGDFVLLMPPLDRKTWLLWTTPLGVLVAGGVALALGRHRRAAVVTPSPLDEAEQAKLKALTGG